MSYPEDEFAPYPAWSDDDFEPPIGLPTDEELNELRQYDLWAGLGGHQMTANNIWGADAAEESTRKLIAVLQDWAMSVCRLEGTPLEVRFPDPSYKWRWHAPSMAEIDELFAWLNQYIEREWKNWGKSRGFEAPIDFSALTQSQRVALMQDLDRAIFDEPEEKKQEHPPRLDPGYC